MLYGASPSDLWSHTSGLTAVALIAALAAVGSSAKAGNGSTLRAISSAPKNASRSGPRASLGFRHQSRLPVSYERIVDFQILEPPSVLHVLAH